MTETTVGEGLGFNAMPSQSLQRLAGHGVESQTLTDGSFRHRITKAAS